MQNCFSTFSAIPLRSVERAVILPTRSAAHARRRLEKTAQVGRFWINMYRNVNTLSTWCPLCQFLCFVAGDVRFELIWTQCSENCLLYKPRLLVLLTLEFVAFGLFYFVPNTMQNLRKKKTTKHRRLLQQWYSFSKLSFSFVWKLTIVEAVCIFVQFDVYVIIADWTYN